MDIFNLYATNIAQEAEGKPFTKEFGGDATFLIARSGNPKYARLLNAAYEANKAILDDKTTDAAREAAQACSDKIMIDVMAKSVLLGWTGNVKYQGADLPYSVENAAKLLALSEFRKLVGTLSDNFKNYRLAVEAEDAENLPVISTGTSNGAPTSSS
jgi:hypothetical protein